VTFAGDVVVAGLLQGGSASAPSLLEVQAAVDEAADQVAEANRRAEQSRFALAGATSRRDHAAERVEAALDRLHESDARLAAVAEQLGQLGSTARAARAEAERQRRGVVAKTEALAVDREALAELEERLEVAQEGPQDEEPSTAERDRLSVAATAARAAEMEARLALRTSEERARALSGRAEALLKAAAAEREARTRAVAREERRRRQAVTARAVLAGAEYALVLLEGSLTRAEQLRAAADEERRVRER